MQTWVALESLWPLRMATRRCEWTGDDRGGERRNTAASGHRIRAVRLEWSLGPVRARWARFPGARALGGSSARWLSAAWRLVGSPAQWERARNRSHVAARDRTIKPSWGADVQAELIRIQFFVTESTSESSP